MVGNAWWFCNGLEPDNGANRRIALVRSFSRKEESQRRREDSDQGFDCNCLTCCTHRLMLEVYPASPADFARPGPLFLAGNHTDFRGALEGGPWRRMLKDVLVEGGCGDANVGGAFVGTLAKWKRTINWEPRTLLRVDRRLLPFCFKCSSGSARLFSLLS